MLSVIVLLLLGAETSALRCENHFVTAGASKLEVLEKCGDPDLRERTSAVNAPLEEIWIYARPENDSQRLLRFAGVELKEIRAGGALRATREQAGGFRCEGGLVLPGMNKLDVRNRCGEPELIETVSGTDEAPREVWLYRQPKTAELRLEFEGVELVDVQRTAR